MAKQAALLAYQRWQIARAIRDGQWRTTREISELVGFASAKALVDESSRFRNFERIGDKWRLLPRALKMLERYETGPRKKRPMKKPKRPKGNLLKKTKQKVMFR